MKTGQTYCSCRYTTPTHLGFLVTGEFQYDFEVSDAMCRPRVDQIIQRDHAGRHARLQ
jgi:hypothetical protein